MTVLGAVFLVAAVVAYLWGRGAFVYVLAASAAFPASAAISVGGNALTPFALMGLLAGCALLLDRRRVLAGGGRSMLLVFVTWSVLITVAGPIVFRGMAVLSPRDGIDNAVVSPAQLAFSVSAIAQVVYLLVGALAVVFLARSGAKPGLPAVPLAIATVLSALCGLCALAGVAWPHELFDTNPNVLYSDTSDGGNSRLRGIFNEPSELAGFSVAAAAYFMVAIARTRGWTRMVSLGLAGLALLNISLSSSGTAAIGIAAFAALAGGVIVIQLARNGGCIIPYVVFAVLLIAVVTLVFGAQIAGWMNGIVDGKVGSESYLNRTAADTFSLGVALDTGGIGVGLGANRPSSFVTMLLSCVGVIGAVSFTLFVAAVAEEALRTRAAQAAFWSLIALLVAKSVSLPDLSTPLLWLLLGVCASVSWTVRDPKREDVKPAILQTTSQHVNMLEH